MTASPRAKKAAAAPQSSRAGRCWSYRLLAMALATLSAAAGIIASGWLASHLPIEYSASAAVLRRLRSTDASIEAIGLPTQEPAIAREMLGHRVLRGALANTAIHVLDVDSVAIHESIRSRFRVRREPAPHGDRIVVEFRCRHPGLARQVVHQVVRQYAFEKNEAEEAEDRRRIEESREEVRLARDRLREEKMELVNIESSLEATEPEDPLQATRKAIERGLRRREELVGTFTSQHPAVARLESRIASLERLCDQVEREGAAPGDSSLAVAASWLGTAEDAANCRRAHEGRLLECRRGEQHRRVQAAERGLRLAIERQEACASAAEIHRGARPVEYVPAIDPAQPLALEGLAARRTVFAVGALLSAMPLGWIAIGPLTLRRLRSLGS